MANYQGRRAAGSRRTSQRRQSGRSKGPLILIVVLLVLILAIAGAMLLLNRAPQQEEGGGQSPETLPEAETEETSDAEEEEPEAPVGISFPYTVADGGLEINSLLSSDIMNPDAGNELVDQLATLEVTNTSGQYLVSAQVSVTLTDGTAYQFHLMDLPAGGKTVAFSVDNATYDDTTPCQAIEAETEFAEGDQLMGESVSIAVDGTTVTLTNLTQESLAPLTVLCHDTLDETEFFGGSSYAYQTEEIPAGESTTIEAVDCILGQPAVVRITPEN